MKKLFKKKDKQLGQKFPNSIQDEFTALWNGDTIRFEMEDDEDIFTFILDDEEE